MPHVVHIGFFVDPRRRHGHELLRAWPSLVDIAESAARSVQVTVVQACAYTETHVVNGISYHFVERVRAPLARSPPFTELLGRLQPDVFHVHGLGFPAEVTALAALAPATPILLQDHADRLPAPWRRRSWRRGAACAAGVAICARPQLERFVAAGLLPPQIEVFEIPESTSRFAPGDRDRARADTGLYGDPAVLWVGRLDANKDPLTALEAVRRAAADLPDLQLWCCYGDAPLRREVERRVATDSVLRARVHLLGPVEHERVELLLRAADLFISASQREGSGYALIEALACGLPPVVTDIPSFRALTADGRVADLVPVRDPGSLAAALRVAALRPRAQSRALVRTHFENEVSFDALGRKLGAAYRRLQERRAASGRQATA